MDIRSRRNKTNLYTAEQIKRVLEGAGLGIESEVDSDYILFCPFHGNHRTPAGEVDKSSGVFFCFSCQHVCDLIELIMHSTGRTYFESARYIKSKEQESSIIDSVAKQLVVKPEYIQYDKSIIDRLNSQAMSSERAMLYYAKRQITTESVQKFKLGYSEKQDMVTIPVHSPDGMEVGFVGRSVEGKDFKNTPGLPKSKVLFNLHRVKASNSVYIVESSFDAIRLDQCGFPAVATLGANVSNYQTDQKYFNNIIVIADNDEAGGNMKDKIVERLGSRVTVIKLDKQYKDIGDMDDTAIKSLDQSFDKSIAAMLN
ncbi:MAG: toprim domain-containing protein [Burkholderiaceae bacterium]|nr:toprim domain-containing protein [Burkholderiaceae bacterium]